ncbi:PREDICTED: chymotrypsin inhibitor-like [Habropoda laboriosa]|uniref:chymotrypsin inhibitor-like n=1 Tax=Habropoda laboriosa TaxID=597456 RepID=UPI00083CC97D|nr:PREDICTED: chymotrypsin inhibitor-like [Habropoda laboriosa]
MSRLLLTLFAILAIFSATTMASCGKNEVWTECGTACPPTCEDPNPKVCSLHCVQGCQCKLGLLRNKNWECVKPSECC